MNIPDKSFKSDTKQINGNSPRPSFLLFLALLAWHFVSVLYACFTTYPFIDEYNALINTLNFMLQKTFIPGFAVYTTVYSYLTAIIIIPCLIVLTKLQGLPLSILNDPFGLSLVFDAYYWRWILIMRMFSMMFSIAVIIMVYRFARRDFGEIAALFSAAILILDPFNIFYQRSHYAVPDMLMTLQVTAVLMLCVEYIRTSRNKFLYWAAFFTGFAISTKQNAVMIIAPLLIAPLLHSPKRHPGAIIFMYAKIIFLLLLALLAGTPAFLFAPEKMLTGFTYLLESKIPQSASVPSQPFAQMTTILIFFQKNPIFVLLTLLSLIHSFRKRSPVDTLYHALLIPSLVVLENFSGAQDWYFLFLYPITGIIIGRFVNDILQKEKPALLSKYRPVVVFLLGMSLVIPASARVSNYLKPDNRKLAEDWVYRNIPYGAFILEDWAHVPIIETNVISQHIPISQFFQRNPRYKNAYAQFTTRHFDRPLYNVLSMYNINYDIDDPLAKQAAYFIVSSDCYISELKVRDFKRMEMTKRYEYFRPEENFYSKLFKEELGRFRLLKTFSSGKGPVIDIFAR